MIQTINVGLTANDGLGDKLRNAMIIINDNFAQIEVILDTCILDSDIIPISQIGGLQAILDSIQAELLNIPTIQADINSINTSIFNINSTLTSQNTSITTLFADITNLQNQINLLVEEAPVDGQLYARRNAGWEIVTSSTTPSLNEVTTIGNTTSNAIFVNNNQIVASNTDGTGVSIESSGVYILTNATGSVGQIKTDLLSGLDKVYQLPDNDGTIALQSDIPSLSNLVPYTGAVNNVQLATFSLTTSSYGFTGLTNSGQMTWNDTDGTIDLKMKGGNVTLQVGQEQLVRVVNKTTTNITLQENAYQAVRVTGAQGQRLKVDLAQATTDLTSAETIGLVTETILNNQEGFVTTSGLVRKINTTGSLQGETWLDGDMLYLSPIVAGNITNIKPIAPQHLVIIGYVVHSHAVNGSIYVKVDNGYELDELHNVKITSATNSQVLTYQDGLWINGTASSGASWGSISGTVSNQSDLISLFDDNFYDRNIKKNLIYFLPNVFLATYTTWRVSTSQPLVTGGTLASSGNITNPRLLYQTTATAGTLAFQRGAPWYHTFTTTIQVLFKHDRKFNIVNNVTNSRFFAGISAQYQTANPTNIEPTSVSLSIGVAKIAASTNLYMMWSTVDNTDLGSGFPSNDGDNSIYRLSIERQVASTNTMIMTLYRFNATTGITTSVTQTRNIADPGGSMSPTIWATNNTTASVMSFRDHGCMTEIKNNLVFI